MKTKFFSYALLITGALLLFIPACKKEKGNDPAPAIPVLTTVNASLITSSSVQSGGIVSSDGGAAIMVRGIVWSTNSAPTTSDNKTTDGSGLGSFTSSLTGLTQNTLYYVRAYATNSAGTGYGNTISFKTQELKVTDIDGNVYRTVTIGTQTWMLENLKVSRYNDGSLISYVPDSVDWSNLTSDAYCWYNGITTYKNSYGALYNWYAVNSGNLCPVGWHVPSDEEWTTLTNYLGGESVAGGKLKETGLMHWDRSTGATNETGFTALPGGYRNYKGEFLFIGTYGYWWSSSEKDIFFSWARQMYSFERRVYGVMQDKMHGLSVRCIKD